MTWKMSETPLVSQRFCLMFTVGTGLGLVLGHVFSYLTIDLGISNPGLGSIIGFFTGMILGYFIGRRIEKKGNKNETEE